MPADKPFYARIESMRGIGAVFVAAYHMSGWDLNGRSVLPHGWWVGVDAVQNVLGRILWGLLPGHAALMMFFVISGFVLRVSLDWGPQEKPAAATRFLIARVFRFYPIVITGTLAFVLLRIFGAPAFGHPPVDLSPGTIVANAMLLEVSYNSTLWAMQVEMLMAPVILALYFAERAFGTRLLIAVALATSVLSFSSRWAVWSMLSQNLFAFVLGMLVPTLGRDLAAGLTRRKAGLVALAAVVVFMLPIGLIGINRWSSLITAYAAAVLVALVAHRPDLAGAGLLDRPLLRQLGLASGSYYVLHMVLLPIPFMLFVQTVPAAWCTAAPLLAGALALAVCLAAFAPVAIVGYHLIEKPGIALGRVITRQVALRVAARTAPAAAE